MFFTTLKIVNKKHHFDLRLESGKLSKCFKWPHLQPLQIFQPKSATSSARLLLKNFIRRFYSIRCLCAISHSSSTTGVVITRQLSGRFELFGWKVAASVRFERKRSNREASNHLSSNGEHIEYQPAEYLLILNGVRSSADARDSRNGSECQPCMAIKSILSVVSRFPIVARSLAS